MTQCQLAPTTEDRAHQGTRRECRPGVVAGGVSFGLGGLQCHGMSAEVCIPQATKTRSSSLSRGLSPEPPSPT